jgi:hypothetical protein
MEHNHTADVDPARTGGPEGYFSVESADESLVFVEPVMRDLVEVYQELMHLRTEGQELALLVGAEARLADLRGRIEQTVERLKALRQELAGVGCEPKDLVGGLVDFPARFEGRKIWLCWKLGEPNVAWWHESQDGFAGRRPIDAEFRARVRDALASAVEQSRPD